MRLVVYVFLFQYFPFEPLPMISKGMSKLLWNLRPLAAAGAWLQRPVQLIS